MKRLIFFVFFSSLFIISFEVRSENLIFLTDLEGNSGKWDTFIKTSGCFKGASPPIDIKKSGYQNVQNLLRSRSFSLNANCKFFYLGDSVDKGDGSIRILRDLVYLKLSNSGNVFLIPGNREINKLRFLQEISPLGEINVNNFYRFTQSKVPTNLAKNLKELNDTYFGRSLGATDAMNFRSRELGLDGLKKSNYKEWSKKILISFREDVESFEDSPNSGPSKGLLLKYLQLSQILVKYRDIIIVHGFIGADNLGRLPKIGTRSIYGLDFDILPIKNSGDFQKWNSRLNDFLNTGLKTLITKKYSNKLDESTRFLGEELILYSEPTLKIKPGRQNNSNQESVVVGRNSNPSDLGNAFNLNEGKEGILTETLNSIGIRVRIGGHTPVGQSPLIQKIINKKVHQYIPSWSINVDTSAEHTKMSNATSIFKLTDDKTFFTKSLVTIKGKSRPMEASFNKDGKDATRIGETVKCQNKNYTIVGELNKGIYLLYRVEAGYVTNNMESDLKGCNTK